MNDGSSTLRFAIVSEGTKSKAEWLNLIRTAEDLGYDAVYITDHVHQPLAPLAALAAGAEHCKRLGLGTYVLNQDMRHPVVLAKELCTLASFLEGRLDVGLGAGWLKDDYTTTGVKYDAGRIRGARFLEYVRIVKAIFETGAVQLQSEFFNIRAEQILPQLDPRHRPRLMLGVGAPKMIRFAAEHADIVSLAPRSTPGGELDDTDATPLAMAKKTEIVRAVWKESGRTGHINNLISECMITPNPTEILDIISRSIGCERAEVNRYPIFLIGDVPMVVDVVRERQQCWGIDHVTIPAAAIRKFAPVLAHFR